MFHPALQHQSLAGVQCLPQLDYGLIISFLIWEKLAWSLRPNLWGIIPVLDSDSIIRYHGIHCSKYQDPKSSTLDSQFKGQVGSSQKSPQKEHEKLLNQLLSISTCPSEDFSLTNVNMLMQYTYVLMIIYPYATLLTDGYNQNKLTNA